MTPARRRAVALVALSVVVATACVFLGRWQWHRHEWRDAQIAIAESNFDAPAVPIADVVATPDSALPDDQQWRPVSLVGRYLDASVLLRNRPVDGNPAYHVLVPFEEAATGAVLVVDRGWVPTGADASAAVDVPAPPQGDVTLVVRLRTAERDSTRGAPPGSVQAIAPDQVLAAAGREGEVYSGAYGQLVSEDPAPATLPGALPPPDLDPGSHLSYAFQWWVFAIGALVGFAWLARREIVEEDGVRPGAYVPPSVPGGWEVRPAPVPRSARPRRREGRAEAEEDALIDAQLGIPPER